jgi:hypothetical protein
MLERQRAFALAAISAALSFVLSLGIINVDGFIVRQNVNRAVAGFDLNVNRNGRADFDASYLTELSLDSVPPLAKTFRTQSIPANVKEGVGAALKCYAVDIAGAVERPWQSFHFSRWNAERVLGSLESELKGYRLNDERDRAQTVITPSGEEYHCAGFYWD